ncbi:MAG: hypothetical protein GEU88_15595, partial [Solirubrobacterales bacterium]|nr:hypothetical protein [Solirubrobacterales bacterium]
MATVDTADFGVTVTTEEPMRADHRVIFVLFAATVASVAALAATGSAHEASSGPQPRVIQLSYSDSKDGSFPRYRLMAFSRRTDDVRFATRFAGKRAKADARFSENITDTDIKGNAKHPFVLIRKGGGKRVMKLIRRAFDERG